MSVPMASQFGQTLPFDVLTPFGKIEAQWRESLAGPESLATT